MTILQWLYREVYLSIPLKRLKKRGLITGHNFNMQKQVIIDPSHAWLIEIGNNVTLSPRVHLLAHDASTKMHMNYTRIGRVKIGDRVFIGAGSIILPGVTIGSNVIIGAGSVVSHDIQNDIVVAGNPAKIICTIKEFLQRKTREIEDSPCFNENYTVEKKISSDMKNKMKTEMKKNVGYVV